jgi:hypothetical protein
VLSRNAGNSSSNTSSPPITKFTAFQKPQQQFSNPGALPAPHISNPFIPFNTPLRPLQNTLCPLRLKNNLNYKNNRIIIDPATRSANNAVQNTVQKDTAPLHH